MTAYGIREIIRIDAPVLFPDMPIRRAAAFLVNSRAAAAPVIDDDGHLGGLLSQKDCFPAVLQASYHREWSGTVADHMTDDVRTIMIDAEVIAAAQMFLAHTHRVFPVLDGLTVAGMLHRSDVLAFLVHHG
ncbi:CBS domain-containing protein [Maritimibacter sp. UBA3975]|uniref:CBS domain-containing protein n=1 Tax=Maritimibacter sp. UBA3975 TaxID=1946833 RepID=UPI000C09B823|nr:CBS domain-containing protein [Maritimibacter sp. UBA3975]MAM60258.1 CBS domain-containing protein [Maritimibacter sp.]|tara:strand:+ start:5798 stop:6190 length:393 start_codon:yes stop_codon:yes gene_type:complete